MDHKSSVHRLYRRTVDECNSVAGALDGYRHIDKQVLRYVTLYHLNVYMEGGDLPEESVVEVDVRKLTFNSFAVLSESSRLLDPFSTVVFDALLRGIPLTDTVIYDLFGALRQLDFRSLRRNVFDLSVFLMAIGTPSEATLTGIPVYEVKDMVRRSRMSKPNKDDHEIEVDPLTHHVLLRNALVSIYKDLSDRSTCVEFQSKLHGHCDNLAFIGLLVCSYTIARCVSDEYTTALTRTLNVIEMEVLDGKERS